MSIAATLRRGKTRITNQALADMALQLDQERRDAMKSGNMVLATILQIEIDALCAQVK